MSDPPHGWRPCQLKDLLAEPIRSGYSPVCPKEPTGKWILHLGAVSASGYNRHAVKPAPPEDPGVDGAMLSPGDILVSRSNTRERVGLAGIYDGDPMPCSYPDLLMRVRVKPDVDRQFLTYALLSEAGRSYFQQCARGTSGSMLKIDRGILEGFRVSIPPLPEQRKIAAILSSIDSVAEASRRIIGHLTSMRRDLASHLIGHGLHHGEAEAQATPFGHVPKWWRRRKLGDVTEQVRDEVRVEPTGIYREIGVRSHGKGIFYKEPTTGESLGNKRVFWVKPGCLILNIVFAWEGAVASSSSEDVGFIASHRFPMFMPDPKELDLEFLRILFQTQRGTEVLASHSPGGAGRNRTLNQTSLRNTEIPLPPLEEQRQISLTVVSIEARLQSEVAGLQRLNEVKAGMSAGLMSGEIRVKPDEAVA